ncbi:unnamed protein product [Brachionus calyciflorus]|uniref:Uncharacterized protein n=1 Tax=Brachionus calyciflorus TaxID=104777 RepID=A0A814D6K6_9BILA|nr:unnamed protein product [Brachionus calyciflorus]
MNTKLKDVKSQSSKASPKIFEKNKVIQVPFEENPFENAIKENEKIEFKQEQERLKLIDFNKKVKERIRAFKFAEQKLEEDAQLIINRKPVNTSFKKKSLDKLRSKSALDLTETPRHKLASASDENLSNFALKLIIDQDQSKKDEYKKRIKSTRKIYSNMERDRIRNDQNIKNLIEKKTSTKPIVLMNTKNSNIKIGLKSSENIKIERNKECNINPKLNYYDNSQELKNFILDENESSTSKKSLVILEKNEPLKIQDVKPIKKNLSSPGILTKSKVNSESNLDKYINNMKRILREKSVQNKLEIPPLCQCHVNNSKQGNLLLWDVDFNKCANNCLFYQNPKEYAKVLFNLLDTSLIEKYKLDKFESLITI